MKEAVETSGSRSIGYWTDSVNLWVVDRVRPRRTEELLQVFRDALEPHADPADLTIYLRALVDAWSLLFAASLLLMVAVAFVGDQIAGGGGNYAGLAVGVFPAGFCLVGELDAAWRYKCALRIRRVASEHDAVVDDRAMRLIRLARVNDGGLLLQLLGGAIASVIAVMFG